MNEPKDLPDLEKQKQVARNLDPVAIYSLNELIYLRQRTETRLQREPWLSSTTMKSRVRKAADGGYGLCRAHA